MYGLSFVHLIITWYNFAENIKFYAIQCDISIVKYLVSRIFNMALFKLGRSKLINAFDVLPEYWWNLDPTFCVRRFSCLFIINCIFW